jgi:hypothetical protein
MSFFRTTRPGGRVNLEAVSEVVSEKVWRAMLEGSKQLALLGVRHALIGGLAVGAHGWPRATKDVDFLVDDSAWIKTAGGLVIMRAGLPVQAHGVAIDTLSIRDDERYLVEAVVHPVETKAGVPVAPVEALVVLKLKSPRLKDATDVVELAKAGIDADAVARYVGEHAPELAEKLADLIARARGEEQDS